MLLQVWSAMFLFDASHLTLCGSREEKRLSRSASPYLYSLASRKSTYIASSSDTKETNADGSIVNVCAIARTCISAYLFHGLRSNAHSNLSYQEPWGVLLLTLEINLAIICVSFPVFWSSLEMALKELRDRIVITHEVIIVSMPRYPNSGHEEREWQPLCETEPSFSNTDTRKRTDIHYGDDFVRTHVDPLILKKLGQSSVTVSGPRIA